MKENNLSKKELAEKLGISRPSLDRYLVEGFPSKIKKSVEEDNGYKRILIENEIRLLRYSLEKKEKELEELQNEI